MLMLGVYLLIGSRSHFNQMVVDVTGPGNRHVYSAMNVAYQTTYMAIQIPTCLYADRVDPATVLAALLLAMALSSAVTPFVLPALSSATGPGVAAVALLFAVNGALIGCWWPYMNAVLSNWAPPAELAYMYAAINTGVPAGAALGNAFTGFAYGVLQRGGPTATTFRYSFMVISVSTRARVNNPTDASRL